MTYNQFSNPSGRRGTTGYTVAGGTLGSDAGTDSKVVSTGTPVAGSLSLTIESMVIGAGKLVASTQYTYSATIKSTGIGVRLRAIGTGVTTATSTTVAAGAVFTRVSVTFTTNASGTVAFDIDNTATAAIGNTLFFQDAMVEQAAVMNAYYDGTFPNYMWSGVADASSSFGPVLVVTPDASFTPPRVRIDVTMAAGSTMNSITVYRLQGGVKTPILAQPSAGFSTIIAYDYVAPYGATVAYEADITSFVAGSTLWTEDWTGFAARWTGDTSQFAGSGGILSRTSGTSFASFGSNTVLASGASMTIASFPYTGSNDASIQFTDDHVNGAFIEQDTTGIGGWNMNWKDTSLGGVINRVTHISDIASGSLTFIYGATTTTINGTTIPVMLGAPGSVFVFNTFTGAVLGTMVMTAAGSTQVSNYVSSTTSLTVTTGWIIHPATPSLSMPLSTTDETMLYVRGISSITDHASQTVHEILGQSLPIVSSSGPRSSDEFTLGVHAATLALESGLIALLTDQTPILIQFPDPTIDWTYGYYAVGDVTRARVVAVANNSRRDFTLPLRLVQTPVVVQQNAGWSWAAVAARYSSWNQARAAYNTWAAMAADSRNPGY